MEYKGPLVDYSSAEQTPVSFQTAISLLEEKRDDAKDSNDGEEGGDLDGEIPVRTPPLRFHVLGQRDSPTAWRSSWTCETDHREGGSSERRQGLK